MKTIYYLAVVGFAGLLGLAAPAFAHEGPGMHGKPMGCEVLPPAKAKMVHARMHQVMEQNKASFEKMRALHEKMRGILSADKFDRKAFLATHAEIAKLRAGMERSRIEAFADVAAKLTPKERLRLARCLMMKGRGFRPGGPGEQRMWRHDGEGRTMQQPGVNHSWDNLNQ